MKYLVKFALFLFFGLSFQTQALADVDIQVQGPFATPTGAFYAALRRDERPMSCPFGDRQDCYFVYVDIRNQSGDLLNCTAQIFYDNGSGFSQTATGSGSVGRQSSKAIVVANAGALLPGLQWVASCTVSQSNPTPPPSNVGSVALEGKIGFEFLQNDQLVVTAERIANRRQGGTTGVLTLAVWLMESRGGDSGYPIATINLGSLQAGTAFTNVRSTVSVSPPSGTFFLAYLLVENATVLLDRTDFDNPVTFQPPPEPNPTDPPKTSGCGRADGPPGLRGRIAVDFSQNFQELTVSADSICWFEEPPQNLFNPREESYDLFLEVLLGYIDETGAPQALYPFASNLGSLNANTPYLNISQTVDIERPPEGDYQVILRLTELAPEEPIRLNDELLGQISVPSNQAGNDGSPNTPDSTPSGGDGSSSGGGGSLDLLSLLLFLLSACRPGNRRMGHEKH